VRGEGARGGVSALFRTKLRIAYNRIPLQVIGIEDLSALRVIALENFL